MKPFVFLRRLSQLFFLLLFIYVLWSMVFPFPRWVRPDLLFKIDPLIMAITSLSERLVLPGIALSLGMVFLTMLCGRFFCGWVCPLGTAVDIAGAFKKKHRSTGDGNNAAVRKIKFYILGIMVLAAIFGKEIAWIFDPIVIAARFVSLNLVPGLTFLMNAAFIILIRDWHAGGAVSDLYHALKPTFLGVKVYYFAHSGIIFLFFAAICSTVMILQRFWCRALCPLGALYACLARWAPLRRTIKECMKCNRCKGHCRMGAIRDDLGYEQGECILCMDCIYDCPTHLTSFNFLLPGKAKRIAGEEGQRAADLPKISRRNFLLFILGSISLLEYKFISNALSQKSTVLRPPAALEEDDFIKRCIRCGNCMRVCPTNALHPAMLQAGPEGIWTPQLLPEVGYCEYKCTLCGRACPTGAISPLTPQEKLTTKLGLALVDRSTCLPWALNKECLVCQEHCPTFNKAIKLDTSSGHPARPYVDEKLCVGCGICQNKCPVTPIRAIRVSEKGAYRVKASL